eukprot:CAMPEP_0194548746 /NCGR_PEP_ID=MMETSP0253-20130528/94109_1 /TAXON_ID=2966 /ORGANISM="Noctiluca scintillans" /LENGTH=167 /DNA_ID=CAMNT_0039396087 /DNA_START=338 /DNA_END=839 /DNA_ORIENTATION=+
MHLRVRAAEGESWCSIAKDCLLEGGPQDFLNEPVRLLRSQRSRNAASVRDFLSTESGERTLDEDGYNVDFQGFHCAVRFLLKLDGHLRSAVWIQPSKVTILLSLSQLRAQAVATDCVNGTGSTALPTPILTGGRTIAKQSLFTKLDTVRNLPTLTDSAEQNTISVLR